MLALLKLLIVRFLFTRFLAGTLGSLVLALPLAAILKSVGAPLLAILGVAAVPVLIVLLIVGLPIFAVLLGALAILAVVAFFVLSGIIAVKVFLFVVLPIMCVVWLVRTLRANRAAHAQAGAV